MSEYLMTVSIGPVQDFIAAARRLRDLWFGSYLLSEMAKRTARSFREKGAELIFPAPADPDAELAPGSRMKAPNKILARVETPDPKAFFSAVKSEALAFWKTELAERTIKGEAQYVDRTLFDRQIDDFIEFYGAWTPLGDNYETAREQAERLLAARKSLRDFHQPPPVTSQTGQGGGLPKSSLDGARESVLIGSARKKGIREYEELDAVGWIKRYGRKLGEAETLPAFESLTDLAADPFLRGTMKNKDALTALEKLGEMLRESRCKVPRVAARPHREPLGRTAPMAPAVLFLSRSGRELAQWLPEAENANAMREAILAQVRRVHLAAGEKQGPLPYTAILLADGDRMGDAIKTISKEGMTTHRTFSAALDDFARSCETIVPEHDGSLIYSGGDDVLAFAPLDRALDCADALQSAFSSQIGRALPSDANRPTLSVGIAIVHHLHPMNRSLDLVREAERWAKAAPNRNTLSLILEKRSGAPIRIRGEWGSGFKERLDQWAIWHRLERIPDKLGYELRRLCREFGSDALKWTADGTPDNPLAFEFASALRRKQADRGRRGIGDAEIGKVLKTAAGLGSLKDLADELIVARLLADARRQAGIEESKKGGAK